MGVELTEHQINEFKKRLKDRFVEVRREISAELLSADEEQYGELAGRVHDIADESLADLLVDLELASIDRHIQEIRAIERLEAVPTAQRCIVCQEAYDRTHMHGARPTL